MVLVAGAGDGVGVVTSLGHGSGVGGTHVWIAIALLSLLVAFHLYDATDWTDQRVRDRLLAGIVPLVATFGAFVLHESLVIVGVL